MCCLNAGCWCGESELESCVALITFPIVWLLAAAADQGSRGDLEHGAGKVGENIYHAMTCAVTSHMTHVEHLK